MAVGILGIEVYIPPFYTPSNSSNNKISIASEIEDINSICMTVVMNLLLKFSINPDDIGRLEIGTQTESNKPIKTYLMRLFKSVKNFDIEGAQVSAGTLGAT
jgi:hydroxymethylglutaryl-CoA synthase